MTVVEFGIFALAAWGACRVCGGTIRSDRGPAVRPPQHCQQRHCHHGYAPGLHQLSEALFGRAADMGQDCTSLHARKAGT